MVWEVFKNAIDGIVNVLGSIWGFFDNFFESCFDFIKRIFVPKDSYFVENYNSLNDSMEGKLGLDVGVLEELKGGSSISTLSDPKFSYSFTIMGVAVAVDYSVVSKIRNITLGVSNGLMVIFLCWYNVKKVIWLIRGVGPVEGGGYSSHVSK